MKTIILGLKPQNIPIFLKKNYQNNRIDLKMFMNIKELSYREKMDLLQQVDCPLYFIEECLNDELWDIRYKAASHINLPKTMMKKMALSQDFHIKDGLCDNENIDEETLEILLKDDSEIIRCFTARNKNLSNKRLKELVFSDDADIREGIAENINSDEEILLILSKDKLDYIRLRILDNRNCPPNILEILYKEFPGEVIQHPNCPDYLKIMSK